MQVLLRDPTDDDVVPIVEELRRRLPKVSAAEQGQGEEEACAQDGEGGEENGALWKYFSLNYYYNQTVLVLFCFWVL